MNRLIIKIAALSLIACTLISCERNLKDETFSVYNAETLTKPENGEQAVIGAYAALKDNGGFGYYAGFYYWLSEYQADVVVATGLAKQGEQLDQLTYSASTSAFNDVWASIFRLVSRSNEAISLVSGIDYVGNGSTELMKKQNLAEARFLRALAYYDATSLWGDVPLITKPSAQFTKEDENPPLAKQADIEAIMIEDLTFAEQNLPLRFPPAQIARATSGAATALLARLYMRRGEWQKAADNTAKVISSGVYNLRTIAEGKIKSLFYTENRADNEFIFVLKSSSESGSYTINSNSFGINSVPWDYNRGWGNFPIGLNFYSLFDKNDDRRELLTGFYQTVYGQFVSVPKSFGGIGGSLPDTIAAQYLYNLKYPHVNNYNYAGFNNVSILRYADVLLMRSEALNELNGPTTESIDLVNQVRNRSSVASISLADFTSKGLLRDKIFEERNKEFFVEGRRREDLFRWGKSATAGATPLAKFREYVKASLPDPTTYSDQVNYMYYPYPQNELQSNTSLSAELNKGRIRQ